jgi:hypothetical protein
MRRLVRPWGFVVATVVMACLGLAVVEDAFCHTDDGCVVETHCIACQWQRGAVVEAPVIVALPTAPDPVGIVAAPQDRRSVDAVLRTAVSRGPPLA